MNIPIEAMLSAVAEAIKQGVGRKNLVAITGMVTLAVMAEAPLELCLLVAAIASLAILTQWMLDLYQVRRTGRDLIDNGHVKPPPIPDQASGPQGPPWDPAEQGEEVGAPHETA